MHTVRFLIGSTLLAWAGASFAHGTPASRYDPFEWRQEQRIRQGLADGSLTREEARRLQVRQAQIDELERVFRADGRLSAIERDYLVRLQRQAGWQIRAERHDHQVAWMGGR
ncbi:MAG TPA: hypothetical protein VNV16_10695 [Methylibium sp.]|nr:hypothetical protein [Methylibium sp.]